jgi:ribosomal protein L13E
MQKIKATVTKRNGRKSTSRGFSLTELQKAGLTRQDAKQMVIPLDVKRKSAHDENVETLRAHAEKAKAKVKPKAKAKEPEMKAKEKPKKKAKS